MKKHYFFIVLLTVMGNNNLLSMLSRTVLKKASKNFFKQNNNRRFNHNHYYQNHQNKNKDFYTEKEAKMIIGSFFISLSALHCFFAALPHKEKKEKHTFPYLQEEIEKWQKEINKQEQKEKIEKLNNELKINLENQRNSKKEKKNTWYQPLITWTQLHKD